MVGICIASSCGYYRNNKKKNNHPVFPCPYQHDDSCVSPNSCSWDGGGRNNTSLKAVYLYNLHESRIKKSSPFGQKQYKNIFAACPQNTHILCKTISGLMCVICDRRRSIHTNVLFLYVRVVICIYEQSIAYKVAFGKHSPEFLMNANEWLNVIQNAVHDIPPHSC